MKMEKYIIDRIEAGMLVMLHSENESELILEQKQFNKKLSEGDVVIVTFDQNSTVVDISVDVEETAKRRSNMKRKLKSLFDN